MRGTLVPNKPDKVFFLKLGDFDLFDTFVKLTEDDRKRIYNEGYDAGRKKGRQLGLRDAAFIYLTLPLWKRILKRWK